MSRILAALGGFAAAALIAGALWGGCTAAARQTALCTALEASASCGAPCAPCAACVQKAVATCKAKQ